MFSFIQINFEPLAVYVRWKSKGKVFYVQQPPRGKSTTTEYGVSYQNKVALWVTPSCSQPQPATDNGFRDGTSNWLVASPLSSTLPPELHVLHGVNEGNKSQDLLQQPGLELASMWMPGQRQLIFQLRV